MPTAVKHQRELGNDVQVIFVECQAADRDTYESFAWRMKWMGNAAMWTDERPLAMPGSGLPQTALIGVDGKVVLQGSPGALGKRLNEALEAEIKKSKQPPADSPAELKKAWTLFLKGDVAGALAECDASTSPAAADTRAEFLARTTARIERVRRLLDGGDFALAEEHTSALEKNVKGNADLGAKLAEQRARLSDPANARALEASKAYATLAEKLATDKPFDPANVKKMSALAEKFRGTKAAEQAERFVALSKLRAGT